MEIVSRFWGRGTWGLSEAPGPEKKLRGHLDRNPGEEPVAGTAVSMAT